MSKQLSIEIPTCCPDRFEAYYKQNFKLLAMLRDSIVVCINFQRYTDAQIDKYISYINNLGLDVRYTVSEYRRGCSLPRLREDTHQLANCPFGLNFDDDIELLNEDWIVGVSKALQFMQSHDDAGTVAIVNTKVRAAFDIRRMRDFLSINTEGGILYRTLPNGRMYDEAYYGLLGRMQDSLLVLSRRAAGYSHYVMHAGHCYNHYEGKDCKTMGYAVHGWQNVDQQIRAELNRLREICKRQPHTHMTK